MALTNYKASGREVVCFAKEETTFGTLAVPAAADAIAVLDSIPDINQPEAFTNSREINGTRSVIDRFRDLTPAGTFTIPHYVRPSGAKGTPPTESVLLKCALGAETINAGVSVVYSLAASLPSFSFFGKEHHTIHQVAGCKVATLGMQYSGKDGAAWNFEIAFQKHLIAGTTETVADSTDSLLKLEAGGAMLYSKGAVIKVGSDDNTGAGYTITAVDTDADTITVTPAVTGGAPAAGVTISGLIPTATLSGAAAEGSSGQVTWDGTSEKFTSANISLANNLSPDAEEVDPASDYVTSIDEGTINATGGFAGRFRRLTAKFSLLAARQMEAAAGWQVGSGDGNVCAVAMPRAVISTSTGGGDEYRRNRTINLMGLGTAGHDELTITFS